MTNSVNKLTSTVQGLNYTRLPLNGEAVRVYAYAGDFIAVEVYAGKELIAWDQTQESDDSKIREKQHRLRFGLAKKAVTYWREKGHAVTDDISFFP